MWILTFTTFPVTYSVTCCYIPYMSVQFCINFCDFCMISWNACRAPPWLKFLAMPLLLPTEGWPGWANVGGLLHTDMVYFLLAHVLSPSWYCPSPTSTAVVSCGRRPLLTLSSSHTTTHRRRPRVRRGRSSWLELSAARCMLGSVYQ